MPDEQNKTNAPKPEDHPTPEAGEASATQGETPAPGAPETPAEPVSWTVEDQNYDYHAQHYGEPVQDDVLASTSLTVPGTVPTSSSTDEPPPPPPPPATPPEEDDEEEDGMLRMSFLDHLEELRSRLIKALSGMAIAFMLAMAFSERLWKIVQEPAAAALTSLSLPPKLIFTNPMDAFMIIWFKMPLLVSVFLASPWVLYQIWGFISPGLYKKERRLAVPFVISTAGLFILGGLFAYHVAFRFGLRFLLGVGKDVNIQPMITITDYFDIFVNVILGVGVVFEIPVLIFMLTLLRIVTPKFLMDNSRYAILLIVIVAAVITPTPDVFNLMLFSVPMVILFYIGIFASYLLILEREGRKFPWGRVILIALAVLLAIGGGFWLAVTRYGFRLISEWPFLTK